MSALYYWATDNARESELSHARTVADMADAYRAQAAQHGGFYVRGDSPESAQKVGRFLASFELNTTLADGASKTYTFYQKNPFLALGDYSLEVQKSPAAAKFRMVSDNFMNPANKPDRFELPALQEMRRAKTTESWGIVNGQLRYLRALPATKACLTCHGPAQSAPAVVQAKYLPPTGSDVGGGYGYKEGDIIGLTSVTIAHKTPLQMLAAQHIGFWLSAGFVVGIMLLSYSFILTGIVRPLRLQSKYAEAVAAGEDLKKIRAPTFDKDESTSRNELHLQSHALKSLHESMQAALEFIQRRTGARS
jgi:hypothetical protein